MAGRKFSIFSDHDALRHDDKPSHSAKINRWKLHLSEYDFVIKHIAGVDNVVADALSRCLVSEDNLDYGIDTSERIVTLATMRPTVSSSTKLWNIDNENDRIALLQWYHGEESGHYDFKTTAARMAANNHVWRGGLYDLKNHILNCACQKYIPRPQIFHEAPRSLSTLFPNTRWDMDFLILEEDINRHTCALLVIDACDRFMLELKPMQTSTIEDFAPIVRELFCKMGKPTSIMADGAGSFKLLDTFLRIQRIPTIPRNSQDNAIVERAIRSVKTQAASIKEERYLKNMPNSWSEVLPLVLRNHNARIHSSTGFAPAAIRFGIADALADKSGSMSQADMLNSLRQNIHVAKLNQLKRRKLGLKETDSLKLGHRFWFKNPDRKKSALDPVNLGPYILVSQDEGKVVIQDTLGKQRVCHISELHPFRGDKNN